MNIPSIKNAMKTEKEDSRTNVTGAASRRDALKLGGAFLAGAAAPWWNSRTPQTTVTVGGRELVGPLQLEAIVPLSVNGELLSSRYIN